MAQSTYKIAIIGMGRLGSALAKALYEVGHQITAVIDINLDAAQKIGAALASPICSDNLSDAAGVNIIFVSVPDDKIKPVVNELAGIGKKQKVADYIFHTSGVTTAEVFSPLREYDVFAASVHPVQTFSGQESESRKLQHIYFGIEGDTQAITVAIEIITSLQGKAVIIPAELKSLYHLACTMASNCFNSLIYAVVDILKKLDIPQQHAMNLISPLIETSLENMKHQGIEEALTGPLSRGDAGTVEKHLTILSANYAQYKPVYQHLGRIALDYQSVRNRLSEQDLQKLRRLLETK